VTSSGERSAPQIFLYGYYGFGNVGDDLLLSSVVSLLSRAASPPRFIVRCLDPVAGISGERIQYAALEQIMARAAWSRWRRLVSYVWATWRSLRGCSHLVFGGGTLFHARSGSCVNLALIMMLVVMARLRGAKVFALGVGVAPLPAGMPQYLMDGILALSRDFAVRDRSSWTNCQSLPSVSRVRLTADIVFALPIEKIAHVSGRWPVLGITLAASDIGNDGLGHEAFLASLAEALERLRSQGWELRFLSFQELDAAGVKLSDSALLAALSACGLRQPVETIRISSHLTEIARQFEPLDVVMGMRFHSHVLAARMGIPFVGVGRDSKLADLCRHFSMPFLAMSDLQSDGVVGAVEHVRTHVPNQQKVSDLSHAAIENFSVVGASMS
jgi:polysaccharide pyruvyl transferase WcaK-like protein